MSDQRKSIDDLLAIMTALRDPETGCPWDVRQSFATIAPYTIEEAYEVADAIQRGDMEDLKEELGDLLLQVVYHARMAAEVGAFGFAEVVDGIARKMVRRHPHVFGDATVRSQTELRGLWERVKAEEKAERAEARPSRGHGLLDDVPAALPGLTRAVKMQDKAAKSGFDWPDAAPVLAKAREELAELERAMGDGADAGKLAEEYGDLLFVLANLGRHLRIDPESALRGAIAKFMRRFARIEALLAAQGRRLNESDLAEMDRLWDQAKAEERD